MDREEFTHAGIRRGNGTGPGTGIPTRTGPRRGRRDVRGAPSHLRSIELHVGGRWSADHGGGLHYHGGMQTFVHFVNPANTDVVSLLQMAQVYLRANYDTTVEKLIWYKAYGEELPQSLHAISRDTHLRRMWENAAAHHMRKVIIYFQDETYEVHEDEDGRRTMLYVSPGGLQIPRDFDYASMNAAATARHEQRLNMGGAAVMGMEELCGFHWYIHDNPTPRAPIQLRCDLRCRVGRQMSNIRIE